MWFFEQLQLFLCTAAFSLVALYIVLKVISKPLPVIKRHVIENIFIDPHGQTSNRFPSLDDKPTLDLSVVIPAYNERHRLPVMLDECMHFLEQKSNSGNFTYEVIVVSDGSTDSTVSMALMYSKTFSAKKLRVLELVQNRGKGGAVRLGVLSTRGRYILFADADAATRFADFDKLEESMRLLTTDWKTEAVVIGSRAHLEEDAKATRSFFRTFLMHGFHFLVWLFAVRTVRDTQCGFKLFTRSAAQKLFHLMHVERWAFDVELLYLAEQLKIPMTEVAVNWKEIDGSKLTPVFSWIEMGIDLFLIWFKYTLGIWKVNGHKHSS